MNSFVRPSSSSVVARRAFTPWAIAVVTLLLLTLAANGFRIVPAAAESSTPTTYAGHQYAAGGTNPSADKPQSKLWWNDGSWWALMLGSSTVNIYRLGADHRWVDTGTVVDTRVNSTGDALWVGGKLYVASRTSGTGSAIRIARLTYSSSTNDYSMDAGFPVNISGRGSESVTIDRDSTGKLWISFTRNSRVWVSHTTTADNKWLKPFQIPGFVDDLVSKDDISALISMGDKIGVLWSDQPSARFNFAYHRDGDPDSVWSAEVPLAGAGVVDDHMNLKSMLGDDQGRLYAAIKTSNGDNGEPDTSPSIVVLARSQSGSWTSHVAAQVQDNLTRPQLVLDRSRRELTVLMGQGGSGAKSIYAKTSSLDSLGFPAGLGEPFITWPGASIRNVSVAKEPVTSTTGIVAIASDPAAKRYYHSELRTTGPTEDTISPQVVATMPDNEATSVSSTIRPSATFSEPVSSATITANTFTLEGPSGVVPGARTYDSGTRRATFAPDAPLAAGATYTARVTTGVTDLAGNPLESEVSWSFTVASASAAADLNPTHDAYVVSDQSSTVFGTLDNLVVVGSPRTITFLQYDLQAYAGRSVTSATLELPVTGSGSAGTQYVRLALRDTWTETSLTFDNKPGLDVTLGRLARTTPWSTVSVPLDTAIIDGKLGGTLSLGIASTSGDDVTFASRESGTPAVLVLRF